MEAKKIVITGGATRIGAAISKSLVSFGTKVSIHFNKSKSSAVKLKKDLEELGAEVYLLKADLNNFKQLEMSQNGQMDSLELKTNTKGSYRDQKDRKRKHNRLFIIGILR